MELDLGVRGHMSPGGGGVVTQGVLGLEMLAAAECGSEASGQSSQLLIRLASGRGISGPSFPAVRGTRQVPREMPGRWVGWWKQMGNCPVLASPPGHFIHPCVSGSEHGRAWEKGRTGSTQGRWMRCVKAVKHHENRFQRPAAFEGV